VFTRKGDDEFVTKVESEKFGSMVFEEKYTDIGAHFVSFLFLIIKLKNR
jgi:hypothetical protein